MDMGLWLLSPIIDGLTVPKVLILIVMDMGLWPLNKGGLGEVKSVLILIVMDMGLWQPSQVVTYVEVEKVLILIVMDMGLWLVCYMCKVQRGKVLILIVMDMGLWLIKVSTPVQTLNSLNPYCNGYGSVTVSFSG